MSFKGNAGRGRFFGGRGMMWSDSKTSQILAAVTYSQQKT